MRKIRKAVFLDPATFDIKFDIKVKDGKTVTTLFSETLTDNSYSLEQQLLIDKYNQLLIDKNMPALTDEESKYAVGLHPSQQPRETTPDELQILAGYKVEPIIAKARSEMKDLTDPIQDLLIDYFKECSDTEADLARSELAGIVYRLHERARDETQGNKK
jgi:hypothetical protein